MDTRRVVRSGESPLLTVKQVAMRLGIAYDEALCLVHARDGLPSIRWGPKQTHNRIKADVLDRWLQRGL